MKSERFSIDAATKEQENKEICDDLAKKGLYINSVFDLLDRPDDYKEYYSDLVKWVPLTNDFWLRQGLIRALTRKNPGKNIINFLFSEMDNPLFNREEETHILYLWTVGNAISVAANHRDIDRLVNLVKDNSLRMARQMLIIKLGRLGKKNKEKVFPVLISLLEQEDVQLQTITALHYLEDHRSIKYLEPFLDNENQPLRKKAEKTLTKLKNIKDT